MKNIFEPSDVELMPEKSEVEPNVEITDGLRLHFHRNGVTFGLVDPGDSRFSLLVDYARARRMMFAAAGIRICDELEEPSNTSEELKGEAWTSRIAPGQEIHGTGIGKTKLIASSSRAPHQSKGVRSLWRWRRLSVFLFTTEPLSCILRGE